MAKVKRAELATKIEYPDENGNGVPDVFENRKPISVLLEFEMAGEPELLTFNPQPLAAPSLELSAAVHSLNELEKKLHLITNTMDGIEKGICNGKHKSNNPAFTCVHVTQQNATPLNDYPLLFCTRKHTPTDLLITCTACPIWKMIGLSYKLP